MICLRTGCSNRCNFVQTVAVFVMGCGARRGARENEYERSYSTENSL